MTRMNTMLKADFKPVRSMLLAGLLATASLGLAHADDDPAKMQRIIEAAGLISVEQATEKALVAKPGTVIEVELEDRKWPKGWDYEFEIVDAAGVEWDVDIDAKTGETRKVSRDWF
ncbi:PepSY domain-containing protein [Pseudomethylobacillus aquaticus]|nr:PepSY domain-containing protein [Pseudomethylobacillus aquaticus]